MESNVENLENLEIIFFSGCDHYSGTDNHGLLQMFKFFKRCIDKKAIFVNSLDSLYSNNKDIFNISRVSSEFTLAHCANMIMINHTNPRHPIHYFNSKQEYNQAIADVIIELLPPHRIMILGDKNDLDQSILNIVMKHFSSKIIYVSMVNNLWTAHCSYPEEYGCEKYKKAPFCDQNCPALLGDKRSEALPLTFSNSMEYFKDNRDSVFINVGNSYVLKEAENSALCSGLEKVVIPLKTVALYSEEYQEVKAYRKQNREKYLQHFNIQTQDAKLFMWSSTHINIKRKGFTYFIESLRKLKEICGPKQMNKIWIILSCEIGGLYSKEMKDLGINFIQTGFLNREAYTEVLSACDAYCSTTMSDAGPRTTYESAAAGTPLISFDKCNSIDFVTGENGALIKAYDTDEYAEAILKIANLDEIESREYSENIYNSYKDLMSDETLITKWNNFLNKILEKK